MKKILIALFSASVLLTSASSFSGENDIATLRQNTPIDSQKEPKKMTKVVNSDIKQKRNYPMQPPLIPHTIRDYEVDLKVNKCVSCHSRNRTEESQAPMVSVTHFMDRDGNFLAEVSPRRYFCSQCHVTQENAKPLVENTFVDMNTILMSKDKTPAKH